MAESVSIRILTCSDYRTKHASADPNGIRMAEGVWLWHEMVSIEAVKGSGRKNKLDMVTRAAAGGAIGSLLGPGGAMAGIIAGLWTTPDETEITFHAEFIGKRHLTGISSAAEIKTMQTWLDLAITNTLARKAQVLAEARHGLPEDPPQDRRDISRFVPDVPQLITRAKDSITSRFKRKTP